MGKLRGVALTPRLRSVLDEVLALPQQREQPPPSAVVRDDEGGPSRGGVTRDDERGEDGHVVVSAKSSSSSSSSFSSSSSVPPAEGAREAAKREASRMPSNARDASSAVMTAIVVRSGGGSSTIDDFDALSLSALVPMRYLIDNSIETSEDDKARIRLELEDALRVAGLSFESRRGDDDDRDDNDRGGSSTGVGGGDDDATKATAAFERRLERLRLMDEERSYGKLTTNLRAHSTTRDDDVTARSMTYAASVGLNMIIAPMSFGVFMYFFAGGIFGRFFDDDDLDDDDIDDDRRRRGDNGVDVRRVIAGVVSGVFMLFVEMVLFVIRSHEIEASVARKGRRREYRANPFGYTQKSMARVYVREG
ncbi:hypothetical protein ACHAXA_001456 [Cyclostephanos tholiformis]|uniref:Uncharacterized protein n=1 Tax=Cyclostephanos tholiformis TaxID=382380 RepID=A0ABD3RYY3_9STRA